jgi:hypothetical protein
MAKPTYDCTKCPAYCCSIYDRVLVKPRDLKRLAKHFNISIEEAAKRYTKRYKNEMILRRKKDPLLQTYACMFLDVETRGCMIYHARPETCREFPITKRCAYYDLLSFEREQQDDPTTLPLVKIAFNGKTYPK